MATKLTKVIYETVTLLHMYEIRHWAHKHSFCCWLPLLRNPEIIQHLHSANSSFPIVMLHSLQPHFQLCADKAILIRQQGSMNLWTLDP